MASRQLLAVRRRISPRFKRTLSDGFHPLSQPGVPSDCRFLSPRILADGPESMVYPLREPCVSARRHRLPPLADGPDNVDGLVASRSCSSIFSTTASASAMQLHLKLTQMPSMQLHTPASDSSGLLWKQNCNPYLVIQTSHGIQRRMFSSMQKQGICWSCGRTSFDEKYKLICPSCKAIQAPSPAINYFQLFDQDQKYEINTKVLEANYKSLMKKLHPDLTHGKSEREKDNAAQLSALVTTAYNQLLSPVSRATYLLKLQGVHVEEEGTVNDPELILEVMDMKETLESNPDKETLQKLYNSANTRLIHWSNAFNSSLNDGNITLAVAALQRMSYFGRVCEDIKRELL